jgi:SAM-dependent methyltransferase
MSPIANSVDPIADLLQRAEALAAGNADQLAQRAQLLRQVLERDHTNLRAHNALERMHDAHSFGRWMHINCVIDPRDDIYRFFVQHPWARSPIREYLSDGWRTLSELMLLLERLGQPLTGMTRVLEFAAGFGRFTRHLQRAIPGRITCTDVLPGSVEFLRAEFGVEAFYSSFEPAGIVYPERYDLIFVLSLFTHLPTTQWAPWLQHLRRGLNPGGLLVFSVHNETAAREAGLGFDAAGTHFIASSESPSLDAAEYGTTFTTDAFVRDEVTRALGAPPLQHERLAFWGGQDAVVVRAAS